MVPWRNFSLETQGIIGTKEYRLPLEPQEDYFTCMKSAALRSYMHCDIKPQKTYLWMNPFSARISGFALAKFLKTDQTRTITAIRGTKGYVAPE